MPGIEQAAGVHKPSSNGSSTESQPEKFTRSVSFDAPVNLDFGDPTVYEEYWRKIENKLDLAVPSWRCVSYFPHGRSLCWYLEPELATHIRKLHRIVGNAVTEDRHIVVGTGSSQLMAAALYALCPEATPEPISVVSSVPYYSPYPEIVDLVQSRLHKWGGDALKFEEEKPYIEIVCSPNNPDGINKQAVVNQKGGSIIHDLAYYWPQYTAITSPADHDLILFTASKSVGMAGSRIGWALVKNEEVARKMVKYMQINSIGVSKDAQLRVAKVLKFVCESCESSEKVDETVFDHGRRCMSERWERLRACIEGSGVLKVPEHPEEFCNFYKESIKARPAFAWLKCEADEIADCEELLKANKILTRNGKHFGSTNKYVRASMLGDDETFELFLKRLNGVVMKLKK